MMEINKVSLFLIICFLYPLIKGFINKFSSSSLKNEIQGLESNIAFIISIFLGIYFQRKIFLDHKIGLYKKIYDLIPVNILNYIEDNSLITYIVIIPLFIFIIYQVTFLLFEALNGVSFYLIADSIERSVNKSSELFKRIVGAVFQLPRAICYILVASFLLNIISVLNLKIGIDRELEASKPYNYICRQIIIPLTNSKIARKLPNIINNSFKVEVKEASNRDANSFKDGRKVIVYYNGVTLDEGVKSDREIDQMARKLTTSKSDDKMKARAIYDWIGTNIDYDKDKAERVLNNDFNIKSGAIETFNTKKGICFDYSCLYVAMARASGLKVRLITGEGFNGVSWVSHAWNQVYIPEEGKWINVDTTFYKGGNYFNSLRFERDHRDAKIAGEW